MKTTLDLINKKLEDAQDASHRGHLGGSVIGRTCERQLWYSFRHFKRETFNGQKLRLFQRGWLEEDRITKWLRDAGITVWDVDPATGSQWRVGDHEGHFGGSLDGIAYGVPEAPGEYVLLEYKTHNDASFKKVEKDGVLIAKPEHCTQMQVYMHKFGLKKALYIAVNKNDDHMHTEIVPHLESEAECAIGKAGRIIWSATPPGRAYNSPNAMGRGFDGCKFCLFREICWGDELPEPSCRNCMFSSPAKAKKWTCEKAKFGDVCPSYSVIQEVGNEL